MQFAPTTILRIARRSTFVLVAALVALEVAYAVFANLFLAFGGVALFFRSTDQIDAKFASAWTLIPGKLHFSELRVTFQDHNVQWSLDFESARIALDLPRLIGRTFHARSVRGDGVVFRLRHRVDPLNVNQPSVRALAPIPEFPSPPVFETTVASEPVSDADYDLWTVHIENVDIDVRELWIQQFRYVGSARASGSFYLRPARWLWIEPSKLTLDGAPLTAGPYPAAERLAGEIDCVVHPHDVRLEEGRNVFRFISSRIVLAGDGASAAPAALFLPERWGIGVDTKPPIGRMSIDAETRRGVFTEQSSAEFEQYDFELRGSGSGLRADAIGFFALAEPGGQGELRIEASGASLFDRRQDHVPIEIERLDASFTSSSVDAAANWAMIQMRAEADGLALRPSRCDPKWTASTLRLDLASGLQRESGALRFPFSLSASNVRTRVGKNPLRFDFRADAPQAELDATRRHASFAGAFRIDGLDLPVKNEKIEKWWARGRLDFVKLDLTGPTELTAGFRAQLRDGTPLLAVLADNDEIPSELVDILPLRELEVEGLVHDRCELVDLRLSRGSGGPLTFRGRLQRLGESLRGALLFRLTALKAVSVGLGFDQGKTKVSLAAGDAWLGERLSGLDDSARQSRDKPCSKREDRCGQ